jgi:hypothetical protein
MAVSASFLAPWASENGPRQGTRKVWGGRAAVRTFDAQVERHDLAIEAIQVALHALGRIASPKPASMGGRV